MTPPPPAAAAAARTAAPAVQPRHRPPLAPARHPRRVSGPAARPAPVRRVASTATAVTTHPLLDRLIHGRAWIGIVAFALIGIVTMQLGLLKLNAGIGRALEHEAALQRENSALSVENSEVAAGDTVELQAAHMGMQLVPAGTLRFLPAQGPGGETAAVDRAVAALKASPGSATATASQTSPSSESATPATTTSTATAPTASTTSEATSSTASGTASESTTAPSTSVSSAGAPTASEGATGESATPAPTAPTPTPTGESGGASASPQG